MVAEIDAENNLGKTEVEIVEPAKVFTIEILHFIKNAQQQHGLRHDDFQRYRGYCTRRISRLRKVLKLPQIYKRNAKGAAKAPLSEKQRKDERYAHIPLISAERAWAYAMQLKIESNTDRRKRFHFYRKLRRACAYADELQKLCNTDAFDARTKLECEAYVAWLHGVLHFETESLQPAIDNWTKAKKIYENLASTLPEDEQELYHAKINEFTPTLQFCAYKLGGGVGIQGSEIDRILADYGAKGVVAGLDALVNQTKIDSVESLQTVEWRDRKITVRPEKVRLFLLGLQELDKSLSKAAKIESKIEIIERILLDCKDAIQAVRDEIKQDPKLRSITTGQTLSGIQYLLAYLSYIRHSRTLQRNLYLVEQAKNNFADPNQQQDLRNNNVEGKKVRAQDLARFYEIILQNVAEMQQIVGLEHDEGYQAEVESLTFTFKAFRCYYIALTLIDLKKWKEAVALYTRASTYATTALEGEVSGEFNLQQELRTLISTIDGCKFSTHAYSVLESESVDDSAATAKAQRHNKPLYERLSQYKEDPSLLAKAPNVIKLTPDMEPIACKPLLFDIALNFLELPSLDDKLESGEDKKGAASITGFVKGFLGWGSK